MKAVQHHIGYGQIEYQEDFWTGRRELTFNGVALTRKKRNLFVLNTESGALDCRVKGSFLTGVTLHVDEDVIPITPPCKWYEVACSVSIFVLILIWGNVPALGQIVPVVGGAIGGAISGLTGCLCLFLMRNTKNVVHKLLIWLGLFVGTFLICFLIGFAILIILL